MKTPLPLIAATVVAGFVFAPPASFASLGAGESGVRLSNRTVQPAAEDPLHPVVYAQNCPPGVAKKAPSCLPPGQAAKKGIRVGDVVDPGSVHLVTRPGAYGLSTPPAGDRYAIVDGRLVRMDPATGRILSILRLIDAVLD